MIEQCERIGEASAPGNSPGRVLTRRRVLLGATAIAINALAACGGVPVATGTPGTSPTTAAASVIPAVAATSSLVAPTVGRVLPTAPLLIFAGASITAGLGVPRAEAFPARTVALLAPARYDAVDVAISGETARFWDTAAPEKIDPLHDANRDANIVVFYAGLNDLHSGATAAETIARIVAFGASRRRVGFKVVIGTLLPSTISLGPAREYETERQRVNAGLREQVANFANALADIGADPVIGAAGAATNREYFLRDGIHPTSEGHARIAAIVKEAIVTL